MRSPPSTLKLFRQEVIEQKAERLFGEVLLPESRILNVIAVIVLFLLAGLGYLLATGEYSSRVTVVGWLVSNPGYAQVTSQRMGIVSEIRVKEGDLVKRDDVLAVLGTGRLSTGTAQVESSLLEQMDAERSSLGKQIDAQRALAAAALESTQLEIRRLEAVSADLQSLLNVVRERHELARSNARRSQQLVDQGLLPKRAAEQANDEALLTQQSIHEIQQKLNEQMWARSSAQAESQRIPIQTAQSIAELEARMSAINSRIAETRGQQDSVVSAPIDGKVTGLSVNLGDTISAGANLLAIVPENAKLQARLLIPTRAIGFVSPGMEIRLRYDAFPYQKFGQHHALLEDIGQVVMGPMDSHGPCAWTSRRIWRQ